MSDEVDFARAYLLFHVTEKAAAHGTTYSSIVGEAAFELAEMNAVAGKAMAERQKARLAKEAEARAQDTQRQEDEHAEHAPQLREGEPVEGGESNTEAPPTNGLRRL